MVRLIHSADWQIGMTKHFLTPEAQSRYSEARLESIRSIAELAIREACDFVVIGGDVFESNQLDRQVASRALDAMAAFNVPVFLLPGNHDPLLSAGSIWDSPTFLTRCPENVVVLRDTTPVQVPGCGAEVVGAVWHSKRPIGDLVAEAVAPLEPVSGARVLVGHGAIDEGSPDQTSPGLISLASIEQAVRDGRVHYVALGDRHSVTDAGQTGRIWYSGTPLMTDYDEVEPNHVLLVELEGEQCSVERKRVGDWTFLDQRFDIYGDEDVEEVRRWLDALTDKRRSIVKLSFIGTVSLGAKARLDNLLDEEGDLLAGLEVGERRTDLAVLPDDEDFADLGLGGFVVSTIADLKELASQSTETGAAAQDALALLYRLSGAGQ
jgi:DNA repair exonuclease SbcCD nuclease subunit